MSKSVKLKKGFNINLAGKAEEKIASQALPETVAIKPTDFIGLKRPKVLVQEGETVEAGTPIMFDKMLEGVMYTSPVSGEIVEVKRGDKRKLLSIKILADKEIKYKKFSFDKFSVSEISALDEAKAKEILMESGIWPLIVQRPFGIVANPADSPKSIFISAFDSSPLAPNYAFLFKDMDKYFQTGVDVLKKLTRGAVHVNVDGNAEVAPIFANVKNAQVNKFMGKHPAGNVGVQIHHIDPINKGDIVWTINPYGVIQIGKLLLDGKYDASKLVAVTGSEVNHPQYVKTFSGASIKSLLANNVKSEGVRIISGNVLTGEASDIHDYLNFYHHQVTVIPEGNKPRFVLSDGWLAPTAKRLSFHRALGLLSFLNPATKEYVLDTSTNGEERAFVMSGIFEKVVPMDILPTHLIKAIMAKDFDEMEALGIYEVIEEDLALCEFVDVSKHNIQSILREGLNMLLEN